MKDELQRISQEFETDIKKVSDFSGLEALEQRFFSRKHGLFTEVAAGLKDAPESERREMGRLANEVKREMEVSLAGKKAELAQAEFSNIGQSERLDVTRPKLPSARRGTLHPMTIIERELEALFSSMGFMVLDGPELESDYFNFEALNIPSYHPARDSQDTFFIKNHPDWVMRTHTSPVQVRAMRKYGAPMRAVVPGRCFRNEATDASHEHTFFQLEGLLIGKEISVGHLVGVMKSVLSHILSKEAQVRLRPGFFPFVEPGFELDLRCQVCTGAGCGACKHSGWVEMIPCGLVHPNVLRHGGLDPAQWSGFAFGLGSMRLAMQRYGIEDIRHMMSGDLRFLQQF